MTQAMDPLLISPVADDEHELLAALTLRAFEPLPIHQRVFGQVDPVEHAAFIATQALAAAKKPGQENVKVTRGGKPVAFGSYSTTASIATESSAADGTPAISDRAEDRFPPGTNIELANELFSRSSTKIVEPHFYIRTLAVAPEAQGGGIASALLRHICKQADEQSVAIYLTATPGGLSLYRRFGFEPNGEAKRPASDPELALYPMRREPLTFVPATHEDLPELARVHRCAFAPTKIMNYLHTEIDPEIFAEFFVKRFTKILDEAAEKKDGGAIVTVAKRGKTLLGFAWSTREPAAKDRPPEDKEAPERPRMPGMDVVRARELLGALDRHAKSIPFAHWNLHILSIDPAAQGSGIGKRLLQSVIDQAACEGVPVTLESTELGLGLYRSVGFQDFSDILIAEQDKTVKLWPMVHGAVPAE
ncbi:hypothetical protein JCM10908_002468 [Rhodotorula pacifica]|uniref:uncharacterized protein n=1 Tax=Rhodotorula pacifica TaxID=1495444 RepID=UPI00317A70E9